MAKPGYDYLVGGVTITNDITYADGSMTKQQLGGGLFALEGVRLWTDNVLYITNVGPDYEQYYGAWMRANGMSTEGANCCLQHTHYTDLYYRPDGTFTEVSKYSGATFTGNGDYAVQAWQIEAVAEGVKGLYLDEHVRAGLWEELLTIRDRHGFKLMWEIPTRDLEDPQYYDEVRQLIKKVDLYSLNKPESFHFFGVDNEQDAIRKIMELGVPCFYRVGKQGSYMVADGQAAFAPSVDIGEPVDPTGCGNCSTASALYCWCEGCDPLMTAIMSNIAAAHNLLQHGPYPQFTKQTEANARKLAEELYQKYKK